MRRLILLVAVTLALVLTAVPVSAGPPMEASGTWEYVAEFFPTKIAGNNLHVVGQDVGTWTGTLEGTSHEDYVAVFHKKHGTYQGRMTFEGEVDGRAGTMVIKTNGSGPFPPTGPWTGTWVIMSGTEELEGLRGQGTWSGMVPSLTYEGKIHFEP